MALKKGKWMTNETVQRRLAVIYVEMGQLDQARQMARSILKRSPGFKYNILARKLPFKNPDRNKRILDSLEKAFS